MSLPAGPFSFSSSFFSFFLSFWSPETRRGAKQIFGAFKADSSPCKLNSGQLMIESDEQPATLSTAPTV